MMEATVDMSDPATRYAHCDCGGRLFYDDTQGTVHCYDCSSHKQYIPRRQTTIGGAERRIASVKRLPDDPLGDGHQTTVSDRKILLELAVKKIGVKEAVRRIIAPETTELSPGVAQFVEKLRSLCLHSDAVPLFVMADLLEKQAEVLRDAEVERTR